MWNDESGFFCCPIYSLEWMTAGSSTESLEDCHFRIHRKTSQEIYSSNIGWIVLCLVNEIAGLPFTIVKNLRFLQRKIWHCPHYFLLFFWIVIWPQMVMGLYGLDYKKYIVKIWTWFKNLYFLGSFDYFGSIIVEIF